MQKFFLLLLFPFWAIADHLPDLFTVECGGFDFYREKYRTIELDLEYKFHFKWLRSPIDVLDFRPLVGIMGNAKGSGYLYVGIDFDLLFFDHLLISPGFAGGYYWQGSGKDLGYPIEFRSGIELGWQFSDDRRIGVHFYHLSNASLGQRNPGEESLVLFYDIPISKGFPFSRK
ncbi:MAG TPA: acyloxyacyl hydrolase [Chlamydiales bacterium]|jgi:hypothetical protein|nr:acyloxyacyl hydrolase [Chlamydiales bacterium]